jgi:hypothetical protein
MVHCLTVCSSVSSGTRHHPPKRSTPAMLSDGGGHSTNRNKYSQRHLGDNVADNDDIAQFTLGDRSTSLSDIPPRPQQQQQTSMAKKFFNKMSKSLSSLSYNEDDDSDEDDDLDAENNNMAGNKDTSANSKYTFAPCKAKLKTISSSNINEKQKYHKKDDITAVYAFSPATTKKKSVKL